MKDFLRDIRPASPAGFEVCFETPPGRQAQVDFAHFRTVFIDEPGTVRGRALVQIADTVPLHNG